MILALVVIGASCGGGGRVALGPQAGFAEGSGLLYRSDRALARELDGIAATGARRLRVDFDWGLIEPERGHWNWGPIDRVVAGARARDLRVLALVTYTPSWARPPGTTDKYPPTDAADFAAFCRAAAKHYHNRVGEWEVWNEPNLGQFWEPRPDPTYYATLLRAAAGAIRSVDPGATIVSGGLAPAADTERSLSPVTFLEGIYEANARSAFDAVGHHPYSYPNLPLQTTHDPSHNAFGGVTPLLHQVMDSHGDGDKQIWGTEMGAPTTGDRRPPSLAAYVTQAYEAWTRWEYTGPLFWYSYLDAGTSGDPEDHFGLVRRDFTPKQPALERFTSLMKGD